MMCDVNHVNNVNHVNHVNHVNNVNNQFGLQFPGFAQVSSNLENMLPSVDLNPAAQPFNNTQTINNNSPNSPQTYYSSGASGAVPFTTAHNNVPHSISNVPVSHSNSNVPVSFRNPAQTVYFPLSDRLVTLPNNHSTLPGYPTSLPSNHSTLPSNPVSLPSNHSTIPGNITSLPSNHSTIPGNPTSFPSNHSTLPGNPTSLPSNHSTLPGNPTSLPSNHSTLPNNQKYPSLPVNSPDISTFSETGPLHTSYHSVKRHQETEKGRELAKHATQLEAMVLTMRGHYEHDINHYKTQLCQQMESYSRLKVKAKQLKEDYKERHSMLSEQSKLKEEYNLLVVQMEEERKQRINDRTTKSIESKKLIMAIRAELEQQKQANIDSKSLIIARTREKEEITEKLAKVEHELSKRDDSVVNLKKDVIDVTQKYKLAQQDLVHRRFNSANLKLKIAAANCEAQIRERSKLPNPERYSLRAWRECQEDVRKKLEDNKKKYDQYTASLHEAADPELVWFAEEPRGPPVDISVPPLPLQRFDDILLGRVAPDLPLSSPPPLPTVNNELNTARINSELENIANMLEGPTTSVDDNVGVPPALAAMVESALPSGTNINSPALNVVLPVPMVTSPRARGRGIVPSISAPDTLSVGRGRGKGRSRTLPSRGGSGDTSPIAPHNPPRAFNPASSDIPIRMSRMPSDEVTGVSRVPRTVQSHVIDSTIPTWPIGDQSGKTDNNIPTWSESDDPNLHSQGLEQQLSGLNLRFHQEEYNSSSDQESNNCSPVEAEKLIRQLQEIYPILSDNDVRKYLTKLQKQKPYRLKTKHQPLFERLVDFVAADLMSSNHGNHGNTLQPDRKPSLSPDNTCVICLETLLIGEVHVSDCAHRFHKSCVELWFATRNFTCPTCRTLQHAENMPPTCHEFQPNISTSRASSMLPEEDNGGSIFPRELHAQRVRDGYNDRQFNR